MPRLILKCPYLKGGKAAAHLSYLVKYIATREGVERIPDSRRLLPATPKQRDLLEQIVRDFPDTKSLFEYEDYLAAPTVENASDFIGIALELNFEQLAKRENYVDYIANRPRVQKLGTHGLFSDSDNPLVLSNIADEVAQHAGNVWTPIISLRREDAARIGFDNAENWRDLLMAKSAEIADSLKISPDHFRWYAAFHNESHHPHIHMICYSIDPREGFLTRQGIAQMKSGLARQIFRQDLNTIYAEQSKRRDTLGMEAREVMERLVRHMQNGTLYNEKIEQLTAYLADRLQYHSGKKQYGYLKAPLKSVVDEIVDELAKDSRILSEEAPTPEEAEKALAFLKQAVDSENPYAAYFLGKLYQEGRHVPQDIAEAVRLFRLSAEQGNEYAAYRLGKLYLGGEGILKDVNEALRWLNFAADKKNQFAEYALGVLYLKGEDIPKDTVKGVEYLKRAADQGNQFAQYRLGKIYLAGEDALKDVETALRYLHEATEQGNQYAQYTLGKLYLMGRDVPRYRESAMRWLTLSAAQGNQYAQFFLDNIDRFRNPSAFLTASRMLHHMSRIFADNVPAGKRGAGIQLDRKLLRKLKAKKIAQGHKADDHEQEQTQGMTMTM